MAESLGIEHLTDLSTGEAVAAFFTPLTIFAISFFTVRQRFDERACEQKHGPEKWAEYQARVPYRIFPGIY